MTTDTPNLPAVQKQPSTALAIHSQDDARFDRVIREAEAAYHSTFLPTTLTKEGSGADGKFLAEPQIKANCFIVASVAHDMGVSFMAVAQSMSSVHGKLMFEGKLIAAVIEQRLGVRLRKTYTGEPGTDSYGIKVWTKEDEAEGFEPIDGTVGEWKTKEKSGAIKAIWVGANKQKNQLFYMGARVWARLNAPGLMLGIVGDDEVDESAVAEHLQAAAAPKISAGFASQDPPNGPDNAKPDYDLATNVYTYTLATLPADLKLDRSARVRLSDAKNIDIEGVGRVDEHGYLQRFPVDEKPPADAAPPKTRKGKADKPKVVSENLRKALEAARMELDELLPVVLDLHPDEKPEVWHVPPEKFPEDDDAAQNMLGRFNAAIDVMKRDIRNAEASQERATPEPNQEAKDPTPAQIIKSLDDVLRPLQSWAKIKETFSGFAKLQDWKGLGKADKSAVYAMVWGHANRLNVALTGKGEAPEVRPTDDATAYRCAIEACDDAGILEHMWAQVKASASYSGQAPGTKTALVEATEARLKQLKG